MTLIIEQWKGNVSINWRIGYRTCEQKEFPMQGDNKVLSYCIECHPSEKCDCITYYTKIQCTITHNFFLYAKINDQRIRILSPSNNIHSSERWLISRDLGPIYHRYDLAEVVSRTYDIIIMILLFSISHNYDLCQISSRYISHNHDLLVIIMRNNS